MRYVKSDLCQKTKENATFVTFSLPYFLYKINTQTKHFPK